MFWTMINFAGAAAWFFLATGAVSIEPWLVTAAFILLGLHGFNSGLKSLIGE